MMETLDSNYKITIYYKVMNYILIAQQYTLSTIKTLDTNYMVIAYILYCYNYELHSQCSVKYTNS